MKNLIQAAVVTLFAASTAQAQQAVQWKVSDGGNGHWYQLQIRPSVVSWGVAVAACSNQGGHLASVLSEAEDVFVFNVANQPGAWQGYLGPWLGGRQIPGTGEPMGIWEWSSGEPWGYVGPDTTFPNNGGPPGTDENRLHYIDFVRKWNDLPEDGCPENGGGVRAFMVEWSADCNGDGVVDYGQCHDGTLPDYNGNNIPDCCERGEACVVGNYPVQWRVADGGNGHWYQAIRALPIPTTFSEQDAFATSRGAVMATMLTSQENDFVVSIMGTAASEHNGAMFGLRRQANGGWGWCDQTPLGFTAWGGSSCSSGPYPNNSTLPGEMCGHLYLQNCGWIWDDTPPSWSPVYTNFRLLIEWSADCNEDGIVDYGQILIGQLADLNSNGIPDVCEQPTCRDVDLYTNGRIDGADLAALLSEWGPSTPTTRSDFNHDGVVDGSDLSKILGLWVPCPN